MRNKKLTLAAAVRVKVEVPEPATLAGLARLGNSWVD